MLAQDLANAGSFSEKWLQEVLFKNPSLLNVLPQDDLDPIVPICRELPLRGSSSSVYLDLFAVRVSGIPVLIECKLWRNPQSRREVIGQILEYAVLLRGMSFDTLQAQIRSRLSDSEIGIYGSVLQQSDKLIREDLFVDALSKNLEEGNFDLIIAGDGIRSDMYAVARYLENSATRIKRMLCLEVSVFDGGERSVVVSRPLHQFKTTEIVIREDLVALNRGDQETSSDRPEEIRSEKYLEDRKFWDRFISSVKFASENQMPPRHGGKNHVRIPFHESVKWITCYRLSTGRQRVGIFMVFRGKGGTEIFERLIQSDVWNEIQGQLPGLQFGTRTEEFPEIFINKEIEVSNTDTESEQLEWLTTSAQLLVDSFHPIFESIDRL